MPSKEIPNEVPAMSHPKPKNPTLILYGTDRDLLQRLQQLSVGLPYIGYEVGYGPEVAARADLQALWATPMAGAEIFGAEPPFPLHEARVLQTPPGQIQRGLPRYGVVGVLTSEHDPKTPEYNLRLVLSALLDAVRRFNAESIDTIQRVGILPEDLDLKRIDPLAAFEIIREVYEEVEAP